MSYYVDQNGNAKKVLSVVEVKGQEKKSSKEFVYLAKNKLYFKQDVELLATYGGGGYVYTKGQRLTSGRVYGTKYGNLPISVSFAKDYETNIQTFLKDLFGGRFDRKFSGQTISDMDVHELFKQTIKDQNSEHIYYLSRPKGLYEGDQLSIDGFLSKKQFKKICSAFQKAIGDEGRIKINTRCMIKFVADYQRKQHIKNNRIVAEYWDGNMANFWLEIISAYIYNYNVNTDHYYIAVLVIPHRF